MTGRERFQCAVRGEVINRKVSLAQSGSGHEADGYFGKLDELRTGSDEAQLLVVRSPLARFMDLGMDVYGLLENDPQEGDRQIQEQIECVQREFDLGRSQSVDGIFYLVDGAFPSVSSPMQYGGHFLEVDRQLLDEASESSLNVIWVCGDDEPYLDFVCDLPGHAFGWELRAGVKVEDFRMMRQGVLVGDFDGADIAMKSGSPCRGRLEAILL